LQPRSRPARRDSASTPLHTAMALRAVCALAIAPVALASPGGFPDMAPVHSKCYSLLSGMSASPYNQAELTMICRSKLPVEVCRMAAAELGPTPWQPSTIGRTCGKWQEQWTERVAHMTAEERRLDGEGWQHQIDEITRKKASVGICTGKTVDECARYKSEEYPRYTKQLNDAMQEKYKSWKETMAEAQAEAKLAAAKIDESNDMQNPLSQRYEAGRPTRGAAGRGGGALAALVGSGALCALAAAAMARRAARATRSEPLVQSELEVDAERTEYHPAEADTF